MMMRILVRRRIDAKLMGSLDLVVTHPHKFLQHEDVMRISADAMDHSHIISITRVDTVPA